jgi:hypothetical protein
MHAALRLTLSQWHLKEVEVVNTQNGVSFLFACGKWLSREAAERKGPDGNSLAETDGVLLERAGEAESDVRVSTVLPCLTNQQKARVLYRYSLVFVSCDEDF